MKIQFEYKGNLWDIITKLSSITGMALSSYIIIFSLLGEIQPKVSTQVTLATIAFFYGLDKLIDN